jgi:hypothetical protein
MIRILFSFLLFLIVTSLTHSSNSSPPSISSNISSLSFCSLYPVLSKKKIPKPSLPAYDTNSSFARLFKYLEQNSIKFSHSLTKNSDCYQWTCQNKNIRNDKTVDEDEQGSKERRYRALDEEDSNIKDCVYCTPSIYVGGFSKCGTTALCSKLLHHPQIQQYPHKEVNVYAKFDENAFISSFEHRVIPLASEGIDVRKSHMLDCTSGSYREIQSAVNLLTKSPQSKVIYLVRDPWQRMGSWLTMAHRSQRKQRFSNVYNNWMSLLKTEIPSVSSRFTSKSIRKLVNLFPANGFLYGEILLFWKLAFGDQLLIIDHYDLEHHPAEVLFEIEEFLSLTHHSYAQDVLFDTSINTMISVQNSVNSKEKFQFVQNDTAAARSKTRNVSPKGIKIRSENETNIHEPYEFDDEEMLKLVRDLFGPSLCLFEKLFEKRVRIVTKPETVLGETATAIATQTPPLAAETAASAASGDSPQTVNERR